MVALFSWWPLAPRLAVGIVVEAVEVAAVDDVDVGDAVVLLSGDAFVLGDNEGSSRWDVCPILVARLVGPLRSVLRPSDGACCCGR